MRRLLLAACSALIPASSSADYDSNVYPQVPGGLTGMYSANWLHTGSSTMNTAGQMFAHMGYLYINGAPTSAKNCTAAGGCSVSWRAGTVAGFAGADDTLVVGIQPISDSAGPVIQPTETYGVSGTHNGDVDPPATGWNTTDMDTDGADTSYAHGDLIAVVLNLSACNGCTVPSTYQGASAASHLPSIAFKTGGSWATAAGTANAMITFDDGTIGWIYGGVPWAAGATNAWSDSTNPDERGLYCKIPYDVIVEGYFLYGGLVDGGGATITLYSDPTGTPATMTGSTQVTLDADQTQATNVSRPYWIKVPEFALTANTPWVLGMRSTVAGTNSLLVAISVANTAQLVMYPGGTDCYQMARDGGSGAFSATNSGLDRPIMGLIYRRIDTAGCKTTFRGGTCY